MKATIIECREATNIERILSFGFHRYVTVWELENGQKFKVSTITEGGCWTYPQFIDKLVPKNERLSQFIGETREIVTLEELVKSEGKTE